MLATTCWSNKPWSNDTNNIKKMSSSNQRHLFSTFRGILLFAWCYPRRRLVPTTLQPRHKVHCFHTDLLPWRAKSICAVPLKNSLTNAEKSHATKEIKIWTPSTTIQYVYPFIQFLRLSDAVSICTDFWTSYNFAPWWVMPPFNIQHDQHAHPPTHSSDKFYKTNDVSFQALAWVNPSMWTYTWQLYNHTFTIYDYMALSYVCYNVHIF